MKISKTNKKNQESKLKIKNLKLNLLNQKQKKF